MYVIFAPLNSVRERGGVPTMEQELRSHSRLSIQVSFRANDVSAAISNAASDVWGKIKHP